MKINLFYTILFISLFLNFVKGGNCAGTDTELCGIGANFERNVPSKWPTALSDEGVVPGRELAVCEAFGGGHGADGQLQSEMRQKMFIK